MCFTTIISSNPHGLQRTCICTAYKQSYGQLQAEIDGLCQFLFRENASRSALCRSRDFSFASDREEMGRQQRYTGKSKHGPSCSKTPLRSQALECSSSNRKSERHAHQQGLDSDTYWLRVTYDACGRLSSMEY